MRNVAGEDNPPLIHHQAEDGTKTSIIIWYDNFMVISEDEETTKQLKEELKRVCHACGAVLKPGQDLEVVETNRCVFLGIALRWEKGLLSWSIPSDKRLEIQDLQACHVMSFREISRITGALAWCNYIGGRHIGECGKIYRILVTVARGGQLHGWNTPYRLSKEERQTLKQHQMRWGTERWFTLTGLSDRPHFFAVTDASLECVGFILFRADDVMHRHCTRPMTAPFKGDDLGGQFAHHQIFFLEFVAAIAAVRAVEAANGHRKANIVVLADNMALVQVINQRWARDPLAREMLRELEKNGSNIRAIWIPTENNPADGLTRKDKGSREGDLKYALEVMKGCQGHVDFGRVKELENQSEKKTNKL